MERVLDREVFNSESVLIVDVAGSGKTYFLRNKAQQENLPLIALNDYKDNYFGLYSKLESIKHNPLILLDGLDDAPELISTLLDWQNINNNKFWITTRFFNLLNGKFSDYKYTHFNALESSDIDNYTGLDTNFVHFLCTTPLWCYLVNEWRNSLHTKDFWDYAIAYIFQEYYKNTVIKCSTDNMILCTGYLAVNLIQSGNHFYNSGSGSIYKAEPIANISNEYYSQEMILEMLDSALFIHHSDGRIEFANKYIFAYFGAHGFEEFVPYNHWKGTFFNNNVLKDDYFAQTVAQLISQNEFAWENFAHEQADILCDAIYIKERDEVCKIILEKSNVDIRECLKKDFEKLRTNKTCNILREYIKSNFSWDMKGWMLALIAQKCECFDLAGDFVNALSTTDIKQQQNISFGIYRLREGLSDENYDTIRNLINSYKDMPADYAIDTVRGYLYHTLWDMRHDITALLPLPNEKEHLHSHYSSFLSELVKNIDQYINLDNVILLLTWAQSVDKNTYSHTETLALAIYAASCKFIANASVMDYFIDAQHNNDPYINQKQCTNTLNAVRFDLYEKSYKKYGTNHMRLSLFDQNDWDAVVERASNNDIWMFLLQSLSRWADIEKLNDESYRALTQKHSSLPTYEQRIQSAKKEQIEHQEWLNNQKTLEEDSENSIKKSLNTIYKWIDDCSYTYFLNIMDFLFRQEDLKEQVFSHNPENFSKMAMMWLKNNPAPNDFNSIFCGNWAFEVIKENGSLDEISSEIWEKWYEVPLEPPVSPMDTEYLMPYFFRLCKSAYDKSFEKISNALTSNEREKVFYISNILERVKEYLPDQFHLDYVNIIKNDNEDKNKQILLDAYFRVFGDTDTISSYIDDVYSKIWGLWENNQQQYDWYIYQFFIIRTEKSFSKVMEKLENDKEWGKKWLLSYVEDNFFTYKNSLTIALKKLTDRQLKQFWDWHKNVFPAENRPDMNGLLTQTHYVYGLLDAIIELSIEQERIDLLQQIAPHVVDNVIKAKMQRTSRFISDPKERKKMLKKDSRYIDSAIDLLEFGIELLKDYNSYLQAGAIQDLWNISENEHSPKLEEHLSNHIVRFIKQQIHNKYIFVNREVMVRARQFSGTGAEAGTRADIWIDAIGCDDSKISLCIEVKGSWNKDIKSNGVKNQLFEKYMKEEKADVGIYCVGFYSSNNISQNHKPVTINHKRININQCWQLLDDYKKEANNSLIKVYVLDCALK